MIPSYLYTCSMQALRYDTNAVAGRSKTSLHANGA